MEKKVTKKKTVKKKDLEYFIVYQDKNRRVQNLLTKSVYKIDESRDTVKRALIDLQKITNGNFQAIMWFCELKK